MSKTPQDLLSHLRHQVKERDNNQNRHQRLEGLAYLRDRISAWIQAMEVPAKSLGPSQEEMDYLLTDLERELKDLRAYETLVSLSRHD